MGLAKKKEDMISKIRKQEELREKYIERSSNLKSKIAKENVKALSFGFS